MKPQQIIINNQLINYCEAATAGEKCLLFLHGWRSNKEIWRDVILKLSNYPVFALDLPGFGGSQIPKQAFTVGDYADVVAGFIKKLDLKNTIIVGHSFGGRVGIKLASQHPGLISKLVLVDSAGFAMDESKKNFINTAAKIAKPFFKPKIMQGLRKKIYQKIGSEDYVATPGLTQTYLNVISEDLTEYVKKISQPTLIIYGQNDTATPPEFGKKMHGLIPNSKFQILPNAGHFSFLDQPEEFVKVVSDFIAI
jgi:pimeloyl-ACP methyl ester carboxylesterase